MIRVCLVDDQTLVRQGIRSLLELSDNIRVVAEASDGRQALDLLPEVKPDVVLMDMRMPVMSGLEALQALSARGDLPPTIILTTFDDDQLVLAGIKAGARGYLLKDVSLDQLVDAIQAVAGGGSLVQPAVTQRLLSGLEQMHNEFVSLDRPDPLTDRETEILRLMSGGFSNKEIANSLGVAEGTVKNHVSNILSKLGVRDRTRACSRPSSSSLSSPGAVQGSPGRRAYHRAGSSVSMSGSGKAPCAVHAPGINRRAVRAPGPEAHHPAGQASVMARRAGAPCRPASGRPGVRPISKREFE